MKIGKKIVKYGFMAVLCISLFACKSTKQSKDKDAPAAPETEVVETEESVETTEESAKKDKKTLKAEKKAAKEEAKAAKKAEQAEKKAKKGKKDKNQEVDGAEAVEESEVEENSQVEANAETETSENPVEVVEAAAESESEVDLTSVLGTGGNEVPGAGGNLSFIGWNEVKNMKLDYKNGYIRLRSTPKLGNFNISVLNPAGKYVPVLSTRDEFTNSAFYLKADRKIFKLVGNGNVKAKSKKINGGIALHYQIDEIAEVVISLVTFPSVQKENADMVKITASIKNVGTKTTEFALKSVLDTVLGESAAVHFYTSNGEPVKNEVMYRNLKDCNYVISKNSEASMYIFLGGKDISPIENFALANFSTLNIQKWEPDMLSYRTFDTVLDYNNSAVGIEWPSVKLKEGEIFDYTFYLGFEVEQSFNDCVKYIWPEEVESEESKVSEQPEAAEIGSEIIKISENSKVEVTVPEPAKTPDVPKIVSNSKIDVAQLTKEQLSPEYIQNLLDRIAALEEDDTSINEGELLQLNAELDAILELLKQ